MGKLADWTQKNSKYLKLQDGEKVKVFFRGYKMVTSSFDSEKETIRYTLDTLLGIVTVQKNYHNAAMFFDETKKGQQVLIERNGSGVNTKFKLSLVETDSE